jgi:lysyl-tRNA synthetase, class II
LEFEPLDQFLQRRKKVADIVAQGRDPYPHKFDWTHTAEGIATEFESKTADELHAQTLNVRVAGRAVALRPHGKAGFAHILGQGKRLQLYVKLDAVGPENFELFRSLDLGDIIGVTGHLFRTKTNELTVWVEKLELLTKALLPLPEKFHGLADPDIRYRQRYLDLIANPNVREIFVKRARIIAELRSFFVSRGYIEVETPMMHPIAGGATARPFVTHHNTFDIDLYLRIAPELYLKRLVAGGLDRVFEINRNFRNEGIDATHNPEFTMLEFYQAYSDYRDLMDLSEELLSSLAEKICGSKKIPYGDQELDFSKIERLSMREAICRYWPDGAGAAPAAQQLAQPGEARAAAGRYNEWATRGGRVPVAIEASASDGELTGALFDEIAQDRLIQPTIVYDYPTAISPLSKARPDDPSVTERFELFVAGSEVCNGFSELNDPEEQEKRFREQIARGGDEAPKQLDEEYIRALAHGLPPTAGEGIGIDRLVMLLTNSHSIREVLLFPLLRPQNVGRGEDADDASAAGPAK